MENKQKCKERKNKYLNLSFFIPNKVEIWYNVISSLKNGLMQPSTTNREFFATNIAIVKLYQSWCFNRQQDYEFDTKTYRTRV